MERNYFNETLPPHRTPRTHAGWYRKDGVERHVRMYVCSHDNSLDKSKWFFAVQVEHMDEPGKSRTETHFYIREPDAWLFRAKQLGSDKVHFTDYQQYIDQKGNLQEMGSITEPDFRQFSGWEGYTLQEINNLMA